MDFWVLFLQCEVYGFQVFDMECFLEVFVQQVSEFECLVVVYNVLWVVVVCVGVVCLGKDVCF